MQKQYDVIIVGTGVAGIFVALNLPESMCVLMITKSQIEYSNSFLAQGGISVLKNEADFEMYVEDTMRAGKYENNRQAVELMIASSRDIINTLIRYGIEFDQKEDGLSYTREAAHSTNRILHHRDITGKEITSKLLIQLKKRKNVEVLEYCEMIEFIKSGKSMSGIIVNFKGKYQPIFAKNIVLATGGMGGIFHMTTNFAHITGDGVALALKHQIPIEHIQYIQVHPTTLYSHKKGKRFLISEAVRGEGAYLLNEQKERFVDELLPRDIVSNAIMDEMNKFQTEYVYLSLRHLNSSYIVQRFPNIYKACLDEGYDLTSDDIPVTPAQHYFMGGIKVDLNGRTPIQGLYAVGETSCTGVHGANRLASNSLLEALVFAKRVAIDLIKQSKELTIVKESKSIFTGGMGIYQYTLEEIHEINKNLLLQEIKKQDERFYEKWCYENHKCK